MGDVAKDFSGDSFWNSHATSRRQLSFCAQFHKQGMQSMEPVYTVTMRGRCAGKAEAASIRGKAGGAGSSSFGITSVGAGHCDRSALMRWHTSSMREYSVASSAFCSAS